MGLKQFLNLYGIQIIKGAHQYDVPLVVCRTVLSVLIIFDSSL